MNSLLQDIRYGVRMLAKNPGFTAIALITLALGIGVNTGMYSVIHAIRSIPQRFPDSDALVFLWRPTEFYQRGWISALDFLDWREQSESFSDMAIYSQSPLILTGQGEPEEVSIVEASANLLPTLGISTQIGRLHGVEEDAVSAERVLLLTDRLWQRKFGKSADVVGRTVSLNDIPHTIIGVLPPEVEEESLWHEADLFIPCRIDPARLKREFRAFQSLARLKPGVSVEQAQTEMSGIAARLAQAYPDTNENVDVFVQPFAQRFNSPSDSIMELALLVAVGAVLLIACVNLANLLLAKATARGKELAVRAALGAGRRRIIRQLLTESLLLGVMGGALGLLIGAWAVDLVILNLEGAPFRPGDIRLDAPVLTYALLMSVFAAMAFGLAPALTASRISLSEAMKEGMTTASAGPSRNRLRNTLIIGQLAIVLPILVSCGLVIRHVRSLKLSDYGFKSKHLLTVKVDLPYHLYKTEAQRAVLMGEVIETLEALPGIKAAGAALQFPLGGGGYIGARVAIEGYVSDQPHSQDVHGYQVVTPDYFSMMEIPLVSGRFFTPHDQADAQPVAIVNQRMARHYWPDEDPIGKRLTLDSTASPVQWVMVVGVVADFGCSIFGEPPDAAMYLPHRQRPIGSMLIVVRTLGDPLESVSTVRGAIRDLDPNLPIGDIRTTDQIIHRWLRDDRMLAGFLVGLAVLALSLASIGLYGMMSYSVAQRTHEIGVRVALGAVGGDIIRLVIKRCLVLAAAGIVAGLLLSIPVGFALASQLYGVGGADPVALIGVVLVLLLVAALAGYLPARRATKINPVVALRCE
ncbi:MAG: ABC transporter permease [Phycisphaerales bacterium]|nr:MAG: ABC transporter permease [Phycisphaerales bacterium]